MFPNHQSTAFIHCPVTLPHPAPWDHCTTATSVAGVDNKIQNKSITWLYIGPMWRSSLSNQLNWRRSRCCTYRWEQDTQFTWSAGPVRERVPELLVNLWVVGGFCSNVLPAGQQNKLCTTRNIEHSYSRIQIYEKSCWIVKHSRQTEENLWDTLWVKFWVVLSVKILDI